jgi:hypothetical protein
MLSKPMPAKTRSRFEDNTACEQFLPNPKKNAI